MVGSASVALSGEALFGGGVPGMRFADGVSFAVTRRVESGFCHLSRLVRINSVFYTGRIEVMRGEKNYVRILKNYRFCLFGNNFNIIFAKINKLIILYT